MTYIFDRLTNTLVDEIDGEVKGLNPELYAIVADSEQEARTKAPAEMVDALWRDVHNWMLVTFDLDFRGLCHDLKTNPNSSATRISHINDLSSWSMSVWNEYDRIKAQYQAGIFTEKFDPSKIAQRPWSCSEVINA